MDRIEAGLLRQMDVESASLPEEVGKEEALSSLAFARAVADNFPVLFARAPPALIRAAEQLTPHEIRRRIGDMVVDVARTPLGNADAPLAGHLFVQPHVQQIPVSQLLDRLESRQGSDAWYLQSQNGNLLTTFRSLLDVIPPEVPDATALLGEPEAVNLWIGDDRTTSRLHNDNYENLFVQLSGRKAIYLIPPGCAYALDERFLVPATYQYGHESRPSLLIDGTDRVLPGSPSAEDIAALLSELTPANPPRILFPTVDPADPSTHNPVFRDHATAYRVEVGPGEMLYIPALWYHQVEILPGDVCISVNYWYRPSANSPLWSHWDYIRYSSAVLRGYSDPYYFDD